ncbi:hypothetical protein D1872_274370 [compost metagenome]
MRIRIRRVLELLGHEAARDLYQQLLSLTNRTWHTLFPRGQNDLRSVRLHNLNPLLAHVRGHRDNETISLGSGIHG